MTHRVLVFLLFCLSATAARAERVLLRYDAAIPQAAYAARKLGETLTRQNHTVLREGADYDTTISLAVDSHRCGAEAFAIVPQPKMIAIVGGDLRGLIYGALALGETLRNGTALRDVPAVEQKPRLAFRGIKFNLPWDSYRPSSALAQHTPTVRDLRYWEAFLDMMVENRFNVVSLWNLHPYTFMMRPRNFPEASPWSEKEQAEWRRLYQGIFRLAKERGLDTYIVSWNIFVSPQLAAAHGLAAQNFYPHYYVDGDTSDLVRRYIRESVTQMFLEYPDLDGIGLSLGEGMGGMTPQQRQQWMDDTIVAGALEANRTRPVKLIYRVPFSSGTSSAPGASPEVERVTRAAIEKLDGTFSGPIWVEMKFNWSHAHSTPKLVKVHGGKLGPTYFEPKPQNYQVVWMTRNEDFFALRWGVPDFIREHIKRNGAPDYVGGYFIGSECYIPALDYFTALQEPVDWTWAFQRQWLFYKLWGRLLYDPATPDTVFQAEFNRRYGARGDNLLRAYALASATQLRLGSLYDSGWDFTLYGEGFLALQGERTRYIGVDEMIRHPTMDPDYVAVGDYVAGRANGVPFAAGKMTPPMLSEILQRENREALRLVENIDPAGNASLRYEVDDVRTWAYLGLHLAEKLSGAVALQQYRTAGGPAHQREAIEHLQRALVFWDKVIEITRPLYRDMPLTHYNGNSHDANPDNLFHWALIRDEVARDVEIARTAVPSGK